MENGVGYVKKNFLAGQEFIDFSAVQPAAQLWVDTWADVRVHGATQRRPVDMFEEERVKPGQRLNPAGFDLARAHGRVNKQFRVTRTPTPTRCPLAPRRATPDHEGLGRPRVHIYAQGDRRTPPAQHAAAAQRTSSFPNTPSNSPSSARCPRATLADAVPGVVARAQAYREGWRRGA
ncbi:MAG: hypothetical protein IPK42_16535 [Betaproteobacteria bacterium]|nr:hypothetical protein [Betaproteobacteria bacterium]